LVVFSSYKVKERATYLAETRAWIEDATWKGLDRYRLEGCTIRQSDALWARYQSEARRPRAK
jgi:hypothetical protein